MKTAWLSIPSLNNIKTFSLHFLILPIFEAILMALIMQDYVGGLSQNIMTASIILSSGTMALSTISALFVGDSNRGIDKLVATTNPYSPYYWFTRFAVCFIAAYLLAFINGVLFSLLNLVNLQQILMLSPICILFGFILGVNASCLSWHKDNPYFWVNVFRNAIMILGGTIAPISSFPLVFRYLSYIFPFGRLLELVHGNGTVPYYLDGLIAGIWCVLTVVLYSYRVKQIGMKSSNF